MRTLAIIALALLLACSERKAPERVQLAHGPLAALMTQHAFATCGKSDRTYEGVFHKPPYQTCGSTVGDSTESAEVDSDSLVVELQNNWTVAPADKGSVFAREEGVLTGKFGSPQRCSETSLQWRQGDSLHLVLRIAPVSEVGTEFNEGPYRMTRMARLGPLEPAC